MSIYYMSTYTVDRKNGIINLKLADSSLSPRYYFETHYEGTLEEQAACIFRALLSGNIKPVKNNKLNQTVMSICKMTRTVALDISLENDLYYQTDFDYRADKMISELYGAGYILKRESLQDINELKKRLIVLNDEAKSEYARIAEDRKSKGIIKVQSAIRSDIFPGCDILYLRDNEECIVAKRENYGNNGLLDNSDKSAVFLGNGSGKLFHFLSDGWITPTNETAQAEAVEMLERAGFDCSRLRTLTETAA